MPQLELLKEFARLAVRTGVNVQPGQPVVIRTPVTARDFVPLVVEQAYLAGAKKVTVEWSDEVSSRHILHYTAIEVLEDVAPWQIEKAKLQVEEGTCFISIVSPVPGANAGVDATKMQRTMIAQQKWAGIIRQVTMGNGTQWTIVAVPNVAWAEKVFPALKGEVAVEALWNAILKASRVLPNQDAVANWEKHNQTLHAHNKILNDFNFKHLHFKNGLGTDLIVELVPHHIWCGGSEPSTKGIVFNPNIPTEENFTMPYKWGTRGKVVATKPLNNQGRIIDGFWLEFEKGKVINYGAEKEVDALQGILDTDEGSRYIGEIALISHNSPISNTGLLFLLTLFDENASCHMALGRAYPMNIKGGLNAKVEDLIPQGYNNSVNHVDFMFGSADMHITGLTQDGREVTVFKNGNFVI